MPNSCPVCGQSLPTTLNQAEIKARIQQLSSPALEAEKRRLTQEFNTRVKSEIEKSREATERQFEKQLRAAEKRADEEAERKVNKRLLDAEKRATDADIRLRREVEKAKKDADDRIRKELKRNEQRYAQDSQIKLERLQNERQRDKLRYENDNAKLQAKLDDLSRKLDKQSGEQLGAEAELDLCSELKRAFPEDRIERIGRGVVGADIVHEVRENGKPAGKIVYECKNTLSWQNSFIAQAKSYKTQYNTPHVMIVTRVFPSKNKGLCVVKDIPVVDKRMAIALATVIREGIIEIAALRLSTKSSDGKSQELYEYIVSDKFCTRFREIAGCVATLREQQQKARTWHENTWQTESKIHELIGSHHRQVDAQIRAIVRGNTGRETLKFAASSENWRDAISSAR